MALTKGYARKSTTDAVDARFMEGGRLTHNADGSPRIGVVYNPRSDGNAIFGNAAMSFFIPDGLVFALSRGVSDGVFLLVNNGGVALSVAAPTANSWYAVVWAKQNDSVAGDANDLPTFGVSYSQAAAVPQLNTAVLPTGALSLGYALIPAGTTAMNASNVSIFTNAPFTAFQGGVIRYRTNNALQSDSGVVPNGTFGQVDNSGGSAGVMVMRNGNWLPLATGDGSVLYTEGARSAATVASGASGTLSANFSTPTPQLISIDIAATLYNASSFGGGCTVTLNGATIGTTRRFNNRGSNAPYNLFRHVMAMSTTGTNSLVVTLTNDGASAGTITVSEAQLEVFAG